MTPAQLVDGMVEVFRGFMNNRRLDEAVVASLAYHRRIFPIVMSEIRKAVSAPRYVTWLYYGYAVARSLHKRLTGAVNIVIPAHLHAECEALIAMIEALEIYAQASCLVGEAGWLSAERITSWSTKDRTSVQEERPSLLVVTDTDAVMRDGLKLMGLADALKGVNLRTNGVLFFSTRRLDDFSPVSTKRGSISWEDMRVEDVFDLADVCRGIKESHEH